MGHFGREPCQMFGSPKPEVMSVPVLCPIDNRFETLQCILTMPGPMPGSEELKNT